MEEYTTSQDSQVHFFISYSKDDLLWAEWIDVQLQNAGFSTEADWNFRTGFDRIEEMNAAFTRAERILVVLSPSYVSELDTHPDWRIAVNRALEGRLGALVPVIVRVCDLPDILKTLVPIDLVGQDEEQAYVTLITQAFHNAPRPHKQVAFPGILSSMPLLQEFTGNREKEVRFPPDLPTIWHVPSTSPFFVEQDSILKQIYDSLRINARPHALTGLGGIGKTQLAIEYTYRYYDQYRNILWVNADTHETLIRDFEMQMELDIQEMHSQSNATTSIRHWLETHSQWLVILDNLNDMDAIKEALPRTWKGHILITTRMHALGRIAKCISINKMKPEDGARLLLLRASNSTDTNFSPAEISRAKKISYMLDGLPLALDQAGDYMDAKGCALSRFQEIYEQDNMKILERRSGAINDYPKSVATTWLKDFEKVEKTNSGAAELLSLCSFLDPDEIPFEIIKQGAPELGSRLQRVATSISSLQDAIGELLKFSLITQDSKSSFLSTHRLVQIIFKNRMRRGEQRQWANRTVKALARTFPDSAPQKKSLCQRCLPHVHLCAGLIEHWQLISLEAAHLLFQAAHYSHTVKQLQRSDQLYQQSLNIFIQILGPSHPDVEEHKRKHETW